MVENFHFTQHFTDDKLVLIGYPLKKWVLGGYAAGEYAAILKLPNTFNNNENFKWKVKLKV